VRSSPASPASTSRLPEVRHATSTTWPSVGATSRQSRSATGPSAERTTVPTYDQSISDTPSSFTSRGTRGPALKPDVAAPGDTITSAFRGSGNGRTVLSGTSMAAPHTAGITALIRQSHPDWSVEEVKASVIDTAGHRPLSRLRRALTPRGTLVIVGSEGRGRWLGGFDRNLRALALSRFVSQRLRMLSSKPRPDDLRTLRELIEAGKVSPAVDRTYPLGEVPEAIRYLVEGHGGGKVAITPG